MTRFQTFLLVLFTVLLILGPLAGFIISELRRSNQTYDPLYKPGSYQTSGKTYFLSFDCLFAYFLAGMAVFLIYVAVTVEITDTTPYWQVFTALCLVALMMGALAYFLLYLNINYWRHTRGTTLSFNPSSKSVTVSTPARKYIIWEGDIEQVDYITNGHTKLYFGYFIVTFKNGNELILTDNMPGTGAFFQYFRDIPNYHRHYQRFPIIR